MAEALSSGFPDPKVDFGRFSVMSDEDPIAVLEKILTTLKTVTSFISPLETVAETLEKFLSIINFIADKEKLEEALIRAKISDAMKKLVLGLFNTEMELIKNYLENILNKNVTNKDIHCINALECCLRTHDFFANKDFAFWKDVIPSSGLLLNFATIYSRILILAQELFPNCIFDWDNRKMKLKSLLSTYKDKCVRERMKKVYIYCTVTLVEDVPNPSLTLDEIKEISEDETTNWYERILLYTPACYKIQDDYIEFKKSATEKFKKTKCEKFRNFLIYYDTLKNGYESAFDRIIDNIFNSA